MSLFSSFRSSVRTAAGSVPGAQLFSWDETYHIHEAGGCSRSRLRFVSRVKPGCLPLLANICHSRLPELTNVRHSHLPRPSATAGQRLPELTNVCHSHLPLLTNVCHSCLPQPSTTANQTLPQLSAQTNQCPPQPSATAICHS